MFGKYQNSIALQTPLLMTCWYLVHLCTGRRVILPNGRITVGRHSSCRIQLDYLYMSREHVEITVSPNQVSVRGLGARNGLFVNNVQVEEDLVDVPLREKDLIGLGCPVTQNVSRMCPVFSLRKAGMETEAIELLSDSDDDSAAPPQNLKKNKNNVCSHRSFPLHLIDNDDIIEITDSDDDDLCSSAPLPPLKLVSDQPDNADISILPP